MKLLVNALLIIIVFTSCSTKKPLYITQKDNSGLVNREPAWVSSLKRKAKSKLKSKAIRRKWKRNKTKTTNKTDRSKTKNLVPISSSDNLVSYKIYWKVTFFDDFKGKP